ncbi:TIM barrel protein [Laceyella tengchongensis]|nr:TIM barrel protein [Laceyella tengchongensis]
MNNMLFTNPIAAYCPIHFHALRQTADAGCPQIELQLPNDPYSATELSELLQLSKLTPVAFRAPVSLGLGTSPFPLEEWKHWLALIAQLNLERPRLVCHAAPVPLGAIFEYMDDHPTDFNSLQEMKSELVKRIAAQLNQLHELGKAANIELFIENAPMGGDTYFEPGHSMLYPVLRTPRHLLQLTGQAPVQICFDTSHARITSNALTYMHRSRSLFAGATEQEILHAPNHWLRFHELCKERIGLVRLGYALSWGDTPSTRHIPFPESAYDELIDFAEQVDPSLPIVLAVGGKEALQQSLATLHELKRT